MSSAIILVIAFMCLIFIQLLFLVSRYKRCPPNKILVIYGRTEDGNPKCIVGGAEFVWPVIQDYLYLDLSVISIDVNLKNTWRKRGIHIGAPSQFTVAISTEEGVMQNAAERLLGKETEQIRDIAKDIILGQLQLVVTTMDIGEINDDQDKFLQNVSSHVGAELKKIGLQLINVSVTDF